MIQKRILRVKYDHAFRGVVDFEGMLCTQRGCGEELNVK